jgi:hypothetical protein
VAGEAVAARDPLGLRGGEEQRNVIAPLGMSRREDLAAYGPTEDPLEGPVAGAPEVGGHPDPVEVHVHGERRGVRVGGEPTLLVHALREGQTPPSQFTRHGDGEIPRPAQLVEVLLEEPVLAVVPGRALVEALEHRLGQDRGCGGWGHDRRLLN